MIPRNHCCSPTGSPLFSDAQIDAALNSMRKRYATVIIFVLVVGYFLVASFGLSEPLANRIAEDPSVKGKGKDDQCIGYALAVSSKLAANGIHGRLISYRWLIRNTPITGSHVFVVYHSSDGSEWIVDNEIRRPKEVPPKASPMQLLLLLSGHPSAPIDVELQDGLNHLSYF